MYLIYSSSYLTYTRVFFCHNLCQQSVFLTHNHAEKLVQAFITYQFAWYNVIVV